MALTKAHNRMIADAPANVKDFGAVGDGVTDDSVALQYCIDNFDNIYIPYGRYFCSTTLNLRSNITIVGDGSEAYGEFDWGNSSTIYSTASNIFYADGSTNCHKVTLKMLALEGDWTNTGIGYDLRAREHQYTDVSIKNVAIGMKVNNLYFSAFENFTITCRDVGFWVYGGGTSIVLTNSIVQGDKINSIRANVGYKFEQGFAGIMHTATFNGCYVQYAVDAFYVNSSNSLNLNGSGIEDITRAGLYLNNVFKSIINVTNCAFLFGGTGTSYVYVNGTSNPRTVITFDNLYYGDDFVTDPDPLFLDSSGAGSSVAIRVQVDPTFYPFLLGDLNTNTKIISGAERRVLTTPEFSQFNPNGYVYSGSTSYDIGYAELQRLYFACYYEDKTTGKLTTQAMADISFGNGFFYRISGIDPATGQAAEAILRCRSVSSGGIPIAGYVTDVVGTLSSAITIDNANSKFVLASGNTALQYTITRA